MMNTFIAINTMTTRTPSKVHQAATLKLPLQKKNGLAAHPLRYLCPGKRGFAHMHELSW